MKTEFLFGLETKLLDPLTRKNRAELESMLAPTFVEFGCSGNIWNRDTIVDALIKGTSVSVEALDFKSIELANDVVLVTYKTKKFDEDGSVFASLRSSIWKLHGSRWQMVFHQGTKTEPN